jgi:SAM-dependent methyltransferase
MAPLSPASNSPARVRGANVLTQLVGLQQRVQIVEGNVMAAPIPDKSVDVVISQEALLHIPDRRRAMAEAFRILRRRGRLAFTDWVAPAPLAKDDADLLWEGQAVQSLESPKSYRDLLTEIGFRVRSSDDLTAQWAVLLKARLAMYQKLRIEAEAAGTPLRARRLPQILCPPRRPHGRARCRRRQDRRREEIATARACRVARTRHNRAHGRRIARQSI